MAGTCRECGAEGDWVRRYWSPDDGWVAGSLCAACWDELGDRKPEPDDYAWGRSKLSKGDAALLVDLLGDDPDALESAVSDVLE